MSNAAQSTSCIDRVLRPQDIASHLQEIMVEPRYFSQSKSKTIEQTPFSEILNLLKAHTRMDFTNHCPTTIARRVDQRKLALGIDRLVE